jgi:GT2 family glycosyltransferase
MSAGTASRSPAKVTIAIPTYNRRAYLEAAVASSLAQTYPHIEVVVSDNASTDDTAEWLQQQRDPRLVMLSQSTNLGMMGNWDACLARAQGSYFLLLSDDDLLEPEAVARMVAVFESAGNESLGMVYGRADIIGPQGEILSQGAMAPTREPASETIQGFFLSRRPTYPCTILLRTADLRAAGGYSYAGLTLSCDARAWMAAALRHGHVGFVPEVVAQYRVHPGRLTSQSHIETWLDNNETLARYCAEAYRARGEVRVAARLLTLVQKMNARSAMFLIRDIAELKERPLGRLRRFLSLHRHFRSPQSLPTVLLMMAHLVKPPFVGQAVRRFKRLWQSPC